MDVDVDVDVDEDVIHPEPESSGRSGGSGKVLAAIAAVVALGLGAWFAKGELDRRAALEAAYQESMAADSIASWTAFVEEYPEHPRRAEAEQALRASIAAAAARSGISDWISIPGGSYEMGSNVGATDEQPVHTVMIAPFELMKTEVTVAQYRKCVEAGACASLDADRYCNWGVSGREDHPINCLDWTHASAFASWAGGRLPSEAEWEYAARSGGKAQQYPWGEEAATCRRAIMDDGGSGCGEDRTWPVCSKPEGLSTQGVCDLAGNVWEWTQDAIHDDYTGAPADGTAWEEEALGRMVRGGGWADGDTDLRASFRSGFDPTFRGDGLGFRLAR